MCGEMSQSERDWRPMFDDLREVEPWDWPGRQLVEQDNVGDWGGWLKRFDGPLQDAFVEREDDCSDLAEAMAETYIDACDDAAVPMPVDFDESSDHSAAAQRDRLDITMEFAVYLRAWKQAWLQSKERKV